MKRGLLMVLTYLMALVLVGAVSVFLVLVLAGPHAGLLPHWLEPVVLGLGWLAVLVLPVLAAREVGSRLRR